MKASERATLIADAIAHNTLLMAESIHVPTVSEIPLLTPMGSFGLIISLYIAPEAVSLPNLWSRTVPLLQWLHNTGHLVDFAAVEVRVFRYSDENNYDQIMSFRATVSKMDHVPILDMRDLLRDDWHNVDFGCYWYLCPKNVFGA
jgi:hypothetical protein